MQRVAISIIAHGHDTVRTGASLSVARTDAGHDLRHRIAQAVMAVISTLRHTSNGPAVIGQKIDHAHRDGFNRVIPGYPPAP